MDSLNPFILFVESACCGGQCLVQNLCDMISLQEEVVVVVYVGNHVIRSRNLQNM